MPRAFLPITILIFVCLLAHGAEPPRLPKDTLPDNLALDAVPPGLDKQRPVPLDNPLTDAKVRLGRKLFFDPVLSADGTVACASCHDPAHGFATSDARAIGIKGQVGRRNAPSLLNRAYGTSFFWDGRETTLEAQALKPIEDALELGSSVVAVVKKLDADDDYRARFQATFGDGVTAVNLGRALAAFERTLLSGNSKIDRFRLGEVANLSAEERQGLWLFESKGGCWRCHAGANMTDEAFHNTGVSWGKQPLDLGRFEWSRQEDDRGKFRTPSLRGVADTAPYMHDGSLATLADVVEFYNKGGGKNPQLDPLMAPLGFSKDDVQNLVAFLKALSTTPDDKRGK